MVNNVPEKQLPDIHIRVIPHSQQRNGITGEWYFREDGSIQVDISRMGNILYEGLHAVHEISEIVKSIPIPEAWSDEVSDAYDNEWLRAYDAGELKSDEQEPGFGRGCPYGTGHHIGTGFELILCGGWGINWLDYQRRLDEVGEGPDFNF